MTSMTPMWTATGSTSEGRGCPRPGSGTLDVIDSTTEEVIGTVPEGTTEDIDRAVAAARPPSRRGPPPRWRSGPALLTRVSEALAARMDELADLITHEVGMPLMLSQLVQVGLPMASFGSMAQVAADFTWEQTVGNSLIVREPIGVVGAITPWNYPLHQIAAKVAPALAAGCTVVLKPSEVAPLNAFVLADIFEEVGLPAGVFNLVTGVGPVVGEAHRRPPRRRHGVVHRLHPGRQAGVRGGRGHRQAGGPRARRQVGQRASWTTPTWPQAVPDGVRKCYLNSGQTCSALDPDAGAPGAAGRGGGAGGRHAAEAFTPGDPFDDDDPARAAGVRRPAGPGPQPTSTRGWARGPPCSPAGPRRPTGSTRASSSSPTVFSSVHPGHDHRPGRDLRPGAVDHPLRLRGRGGRDRQRHRLRAGRRRVVGRSRAGQGGGPAGCATGQVEVNGGGFNPMAPFGGYKQSGNGREFGASAWRSTSR